MKQRSSYRLAALALALGVLTTPELARGTNLARPNAFSALGLGIGGAGFAGVANPSTIHFNPAGMTLIRHTMVYAGLDLVLAPRGYEPLAGPIEETNTSPLPAPSLAATTRIASEGGVGPLPLAFGLAVHVPFGGAMSFDEASVTPGVIHFTNLLVEISPAIAYEVSSKLSLGLALRFGVGIFDLKNTEQRGAERQPSELSASGLTVGVSLGVMFQPWRWLRIGAVYGSPMAVNLSGDGRVELTPDNWARDSFDLEAPWPQWAALGLAVRAGDDVEIFGAVRWTDWSEANTLVINMRQTNEVHEVLDYTDGISLHLGAEWRATRSLTTRAGISFDSNVAPDRTMQRAFSDAPKLAFAPGLSLRLSEAWELHFAYELLFVFTRDVPDRVDVDPETGTEVHVNLRPGSYSASMHTFSLAATFRY